MSGANQRRSGSTLLELLVAVSILALVVGVPLALLRSSEALQTATTTRAELRLHARRVLDGVAERLAGASATTVVEYAAPPTGAATSAGTSSVDFQVASGWSAGAVTWNGTERLALAPSPTDPDNGSDDDGDGLVDERQLVWTIDVGLPSQRSLVLASEIPESLEGEVPGNAADDNGNGLVDEPGFVVAFGVDEAVVWMTIAGRDAKGARVEHTAERRIAFRN